MIDGILFDKDGTLFDFRKSWGGWAQLLLARLADDPAHAARLAAAIGYLPETRDFDPSSVVIAGTAAEVAAALLPLLPGRDSAALTAEVNAAAASVAMMPAVDLAPLFAEFRRRGLKLGVATNDAEAPALAHLGAHDLIRSLDFIAGYDSGHGAKPGPGMCLAFARQTGLDPARLVMVGDSLHDLEAGRAAGMRTVAVLTGIARAETLAPHADAVLADIGALPGWIDAQA